MEKIKTPSFNALDNLSDLLEKKVSNVDYEHIRKKIANYLVDEGSQKFVDLYNEAIVAKDYKEILQKLKLE
jgi:hypothetical protein